MAHSADNSTTTLPAELRTASLRRARQVLAGPHVCQLCDEDEAATMATSYCFQCDVKVCVTCCDHHRTLRAITDHRLEDLSTLTPQALSQHLLSCCANHPARDGDVYCASHLEIICLACSTIHHRNCPDVRPVSEDAENEMRNQLLQLTQTVRAREEAQAFSRQNDFNQQRARVKEVFDDLEQQLQEKRRQMVGEIDQQQESATAPLEELHARVQSHVALMEHALRMPSDALLIQMMKELEPEALELDERCARVEEELNAPRPAVEIDRGTIARITEALSTLGDFGVEGTGETASSAAPVTVPSAESNPTPHSAAAGASISTPTTTTTPNTPKQTGSAPGC